MTVWAATNTLRCELQDYGDDILGRPSGEAVAALALVEAALDAAERVVDFSKPLTAEELGRRKDALVAALRAVREGAS